MPYIALVERDDQGRDIIVGWEEYKGVIPYDPTGTVRYSNYISQTTELQDGYIYYIVNGQLRSERVDRCTPEDALHDAKKTRIEYINAVYANYLGRHLPAEVIAQLYAYKDVYDPKSSEYGKWVNDLHHLRNEDIETILSSATEDEVNSIHPSLDKIHEAPLFDLIPKRTATKDSYTVIMNDLNIPANSESEQIPLPDLPGGTLICSGTFRVSESSVISNTITNASEDLITIIPGSIVLRYDIGTAINAEWIIQGGGDIDSDATALEITFDRVLVRKMTMYIGADDEVEISFVDTGQTLGPFSGPEVIIEPNMMLSQIKASLSQVSKISGLSIIGSRVNPVVTKQNIPLSRGELIINNSSSYVTSQVLDASGVVIYNHDKQGGSPPIDIEDGSTLMVNFDTSIDVVSCTYNITVVDDTIELVPVKIAHYISNNSITVFNSTDNDMNGDLILTVSL